MEISQRIENWVFNHYALRIEICLDENAKPLWEITNYTEDSMPLNGNWSCPNISVTGQDLESAFNAFLAALEDKRK